MIKKTFFYLMIFLAAVVAQEKKTQIAVLDIVDPNLKQSEAIALTERLIYILEQTGQYTLLDRGMTAQILQEQGFQQSGCTSGECAVEVGQLLGVQKMVSCKIGAVGKYYTISLRIVDVATGAIDKSAGYDIVGTVEDVLIKGLKEAVAQLVGEPVKEEMKSTIIQPVKSEKESQTKTAKSDKKSKADTAESTGSSNVSEALFNQKKKTKVVIFSGLTGVGAIGSGVFWALKVKEHKLYLGSTDQGTMDAHIDKEKMSALISAAGAGVAVLCTPLAIISAKKKFKNPAATVSFAPVISSQSAGLLVLGEF